MSLQVSKLLFNIIIIDLLLSWRVKCEQPTCRVCAERRRGKRWGGLHLWQQTQHRLLCRTDKPQEHNKYCVDMRVDSWCTSHFQTQTSGFNVKQMLKATETTWKQISVAMSKDLRNQTRWNPAVHLIWYRQINSGAKTTCTSGLFLIPVLFPGSVFLLCDPAPPPPPRIHHDTAQTGHHGLLGWNVQRPGTLCSTTP